MQGGAKGRNVKEEAAELPPPVEFVPPPQPEPEPEPEIEQPPSPPTPVAEMDLLNFDEPESTVPVRPNTHTTSLHLERSGTARRAKWAHQSEREWDIVGRHRVVLVLGCPALPNNLAFIHISLCPLSLNGLC